MLGNYYPERAGEFPVATLHGLACAEGAITLQGKGGNAGKQVIDVFGIFTGNSHFLLQAVASRLHRSQELKKKSKKPISETCVSRGSFPKKIDFSILDT